MNTFANGTRANGHAAAPTSFRTDEIDPQMLRATRAAPQDGDDRLGDEASSDADADDALGLLARGIAHDFNNLLLIMMLYSDTIRRRADDEELQWETQEILRAVERARGLTRQLQTFAGAQPQSSEALDLCEVLSGLQPQVHRTMPEGVAVETMLSRRLWPILADRDRVEEAVLGLAAHAAARMPKGGTYTLEAENHTIEEDGEVPAGDYVRMLAVDDGITLAREHLARLFEPFYASKRLGFGSGLGLATCHAIIAQAGGHMTVESCDGTGTRFAIYLPRHDEDDGDGKTREN